MAFLNSNQVKMFPSAFRNRQVDPESYLNTEYNVTHTGYTGPDASSFAYFEGSDLFVLNLRGYVFRINKTDIPTASSSAANKTIYAHIKLEAHTTRDSQNNIIYTNYILSSIDGSGLDNQSNQFTGIEFLNLDTEPTTTDTDIYLEVRNAAGELHITHANVDDELSLISENPVQNKVITAALETKQPNITSSNKLSADLIANGSTNKVVTQTEKNTWNAKQNALTTSQLNAANSGITQSKVNSYDGHISNTSIHVTSAEKTTWNGKQNKLTAGNNIIISDDNIISAELGNEYPLWYLYENVTLEINDAQASASLLSFITTVALDELPLINNRIALNDFYSNYIMVNLHRSDYGTTTSRTYQPANITYQTTSSGGKVCTYLVYVNALSAGTASVNSISVSAAGGTTVELNFTPETVVTPIERNII